MTPEHRKLLESRTDAHSQFVASILRRREAGVSRQMTTQEIASMFCTEHQAWKCKQH